MKYRIAISILALFLVLFTGFSASAGGHEHEHGDEDYGVLYDACPGGGKHYMEARGRGNVYVDGELVVQNGTTSQCTKCYMVIVSENNPYYYFTTNLGNYGSESANYNVGTFTYLYTNYLYYNSSLSDMDGYEWY